MTAADPIEEAECRVCGGSGEVEVTMQDTVRDVVGCPLCIAQEKDTVIADLTSRLHAAIAKATGAA